VSQHEAISTILEKAHTLAVVGFSSRRTRAGFYVPAYLSQAGFDIIPVNPHLERGLGEQCYPDLASIPRPFDGVVIFRRPEYVPAIVEGAIEAGAWFVWMQQGIVNMEAAERARQAGLLVVMDACMMVEHRLLGGQVPPPSLNPRR
jgi:predicted CoA-binding protein